MEFLLVNHPLDCPVCDEGGECQLQDLAFAFGGYFSRTRTKRTWWSPRTWWPVSPRSKTGRCILCTRCVRFGQEIAGVMELGMAGRGRSILEILTFVVGRTVDSELSGNMIDLCPVGADLEALPLFRAHLGAGAAQVGVPARRAGSASMQVSRSA